MTSIMVAAPISHASPRLCASALTVRTPPAARCPAALDKVLVCQYDQPAARVATAWIGQKGAGVTFLEILYLLVGIYYVIDGTAGYLQTRNWLFLSELLGAWLIASTRIGYSVPALWLWLIAVGALSLIPIAVSLWGAFRSERHLQPVREFLVIKRQPRDVLTRYTFRYKPYSQLPPYKPRPAIPARKR